MSNITERERVIDALKEGIDDKMHPTNVPILLGYARDHLLKPIDMVLFCPLCGAQHVDAPEPERLSGCIVRHREAWTNPPHRSHLCHACGCIWRPADVPTNGVLNIMTTGSADTWDARIHGRAHVAYVADDKQDELRAAYREMCELMKDLFQRMQESYEAQSAIEVPDDTDWANINHCIKRCGDAYQAVAVPMPAMPADARDADDEILRREWRNAGGSMHGPNVETVTMPEALYFRFRRALR